MPTEPRPPVSHRKLGLFGLAVLIGAGLIVATGIRAREDSGTKLKEWTDAQSVPTVAVAAPNARALNATIDLPGRLEAYSRAPIVARVSVASDSFALDCWLARSARACSNCWSRSGASISAITWPALTFAPMSALQLFR